MRHMMLTLIAVVATFAGSQADAAVHDVKAAKKEALSLGQAMDKIELRCTEKRLRNVRFWADKVGDLANDLDDELDEIEQTGASDHAVRKTFLEMHGAYLNLRLAVKHVTDPKFRKEVLQGTLDDFEDLADAIYGARITKVSSPDEIRKPPGKPETLNSASPGERDGLDRPLYDPELDGGPSAKSHRQEKNSKLNEK